MSTINLPVQSVKTIVDIDNRWVTIPVEDAIKTLAETKDKDKEKGIGIRTMFAAPDEDSSSEVEYNYEVAYINRISQNEITVFNKEVKYWSIKFKYYNDTPIEFIVPGFVKFWSQNNKTFVPVEFMKKSDLLIDYTGAMVQVVKKTELPDIDLTGEQFYGIQINSPSDNYMSQFYLNGILASVSYNNYSKE